jgi:hypothetical protein
MPLIATPADPSANSFLTLEEAVAYFAGRPFSDAFTGEESTLIWATSQLNVLCWTGSATTQTQALTWPRTGMVNRNGGPIDPMIIPQELKNATAELALVLSTGDPTGQLQALGQGLSRMTAGPVTFEWDKELLLKSLEKGSYLPQAVTNLLVPSWLCVNVSAAESGTPLFEVV